MKLSSFYLFPTFSMVLLSNYSIEQHDCQNGSMRQAWYEKGIHTEFSPTSTMPGDFMIWVSRDSLAWNFFSEQEDYYRRNSDTNGLFLDPTTGERNQVSGEELRRRKEQREKYLLFADEEHIRNNSNKHVVWMLNNTSDTVYFPIQDGSFICILEAQNDLKEWHPIEFWHFSWCGNSYWIKGIRPLMAISFVFDFPDDGDYSTVLRFKMLGSDKFYYSNEFRGEIDYCEFFNDPDEFVDQGFVYKLEEFKKIEWRRGE